MFSLHRSETRMQPPQDPRDILMILTWCLIVVALFYFTIHQIIYLFNQF